MKIKVNSKVEVIRSLFQSVMMIVCGVFFFGLITYVVNLLLLQHLFGFDSESARQYSNVFTPVLMTGGMFMYLNFILKSLSHYKLCLENNNFIINGRDGWTYINQEIEFESVKSIFIGQFNYTVNDLKSRKKVIRNIDPARLTFIKNDNSVIKIDHAYHAFNNESLCEFLVLMSEKGIESNIKRE